MTEINFDRIVSYGCSFTAGSELYDHHGLEMTEDQLRQFVSKRKITGSYQLYKELKTVPEIINNITENNAKLSWPNYVARHFNVYHENRAVPGSALSHTVYKILSDLHTAQITPTDLILVGLTTPTRWFQFLSDGTPTWGVLGHGWKGLIDPSHRKFLEENWFNAYNTFYHYFKDIAFLSNLSDTLGGRIKLGYTFVSASNLKDTLHVEMQDEKFAKFFEFCSTMCPTHNILHSESTIIEMAGETKSETHHVFGHPRVCFHKEYAKQIIPQIENVRISSL